MKGVHNHRAGQFVQAAADVAFIDGKVTIDMTAVKSWADNQFGGDGFWDNWCCRHEATIWQPIEWMSEKRTPPGQTTKSRILGSSQYYSNLYADNPFASLEEAGGGRPAWFDQTMGFGAGKNFYFPNDPQIGDVFWAVPYASASSGTCARFDKNVQTNLVDT